MSNQAALLLKVSQVPDWERRAIRLSLALIFFTTLGLTLWLVPEQYRAEWGDEVVQSCNWAGATCAVVAASPLIGKVAQLSYERTLGTLTGGLLGFLVYDYGVLQLPEIPGRVLMVAAAAAVGFLSCWLSFKFKLDASMRLFVITFLIVTFGAHNADSRSALGVALLRTGGIVLGVLIFMGLTIIILPKSATIESLREMKSGLKLLTELNTLVWASRTEAAAVMKQAAAAARTAEAAAAAAAAAGAQQQLLPAGSSSNIGRSWGFWQGLGLSRNSRSATAAAAANAHEYQPLLGHDPEAGLVHPAAAASSSSSRVSQLTQALWQTTGNSDETGSANQPAAAAAAKPQQQQQQGPAMPSYESVMEQYEQKCEEVLTSVYQSMFKVKEHIALAESEVYLYHFWGHYLFLPIFFNRTFVDWLWPKRWKLPKKKMEDLSTSVRVIARLLWTVHMDYSQGFDEVLAALPASANMRNLLEELGQLTSATLGVLVEAFPNKDAIMVDSLNRLDKLVDSMLALSAEQHEALIRDLTANRQPARLGMSTTTAAPAAAAAAAGQAPAATVPSSIPSRAGTFARRSLDYPPAAAAASGGGGVPASPGSSWQQQQQTPRQVAFVTLDDGNDYDLATSITLDGPGLPIRSDSPQLRLSPRDRPSHMHSAAAGSTGGSSSSTAALDRTAAAAADDTQGDLMFPMADTEQAVGVADPQQGFSPTKAQQGFSFQDHQGLSLRAHQGLRSSPIGQLLSPRGQQGSPTTPRGFGRTSSVISKSRFKPYAVMAAVKLHTAAANGSARSMTRAAEAAAAAAAVSHVQGLAESDVAVEHARSLVKNLSTVSAPDASVVRSAAAALQQQGMLPGPGSGTTAAAAAAGSPAAAADQEKGEDQSPVEEMSFVKLMRLYSFQILMDELLAEMDELYCCVKEVVQVLPHGL